MTFQELASPVTPTPPSLIPAVTSVPEGPPASSREPGLCAPHIQGSVSLHSTRAAAVMPRVSVLCSLSPPLASSAAAIPAQVPGRGQAPLGRVPEPVKACAPRGDVAEWEAHAKLHGRAGGRVGTGQDTVPPGCQLRPAQIPREAPPTSAGGRGGARAEPSGH